jgi:phosphonate transport system ATP-binding protein
MFHLKNISVSYNNEPVLRNINLTIREGEQVVLIGPSGAGKTTLLRKLYEVQKDRSTFIHQDYALVPQLSAFHNVYMGRLDQHNVFYNALTAARPQHRELDAITPLLTDLNLNDKLRERVSELSGGQQQRVAVARALYRNADIVLGDEPVSSVDPHQSDTVLTLLKQKAPTLILAMHDVDLALKHFNRLIGLRRGRIAFDLPSADINGDRLTKLFAP